MISQEARIEVPPTKGAKVKATLVDLWLIEEMARTLKLNQLILGSGDQGPVHSTTTTIRMIKGRQKAAELLHNDPDATC